MRARGRAAAHPVPPASAGAPALRGRAAAPPRALASARSLRFRAGAQAATRGVNNPPGFFSAQRGCTDSGLRGSENGLRSEVGSPAPRGRAGAADAPLGAVIRPPSAPCGRAADGNVAAPIEARALGPARARGRPTASRPWPPCRHRPCTGAQAAQQAGSDNGAVILDRPRANVCVGGATAGLPGPARPGPGRARRPPKERGPCSASLPQPRLRAGGGSEAGRGRAPGAATGPARAYGRAGVRPPGGLRTRPRPPAAGPGTVRKQSGHSPQVAPGARNGKKGYGFSP